MFDQRRRIVSVHLCLAALVAPVVWGCDGGSTGPGPTPAAVVAVSGDAQSAAAGTVLPSPLVVEVRDGGRQPLAGIAVQWAVVSGHGTVAAVAARTDESGRASAQWRLGSTAGEQAVEARVAGLAPVPFGAQGVPGPAAALVLTPGADTLTAIGDTVTLAVAVSDRYGNEVAEAEASFTSLDADVASVDAAGRVVAEGSGTARIVAVAGEAADTAAVVVRQEATELSITTPVDTLAAGAAVGILAAAVDANGVAIPAAALAWVSSDTAVAVVDDNGSVEGRHVGTATITASAGDLSDAVTMTVTPGAAVALVVVSGDDQSATVSEAVPQPLVVRIEDAFGNGVPGVLVDWSVVAGAGSIAPADGATDADGLARTAWTLGPDLVANTVRATAPGLGEARFDATPYSLLDRWILDRPKIAEAIVWEDAEGFHPFAEWTLSQRNDLLEYYGYAQAGSFPIDDPLPNAATLPDNDFPQTVLSPADAWSLYLAHVANSIQLERSGTLGWTIEDYNEDELRVLFHSRMFYFYYDHVSGYPLWFEGTGASLVLPAPPDYVRDFLTTEGILAPTRLETIVRLITWMRDNVIHSAGGYRVDIFEDIWGYRGAAPVSRIIEVTDTLWNGVVNHFTSGCHGTAAFLAYVLRAVNIPAYWIALPGSGHGTPYFITEHLYLSHGDDPYGTLSKGHGGLPPAFPAEALLIDQAQYDAWFGENVPREEQKNNVSRQPFELAIQYLSPSLLYDRCEDIDAGTPKEDGEVYEHFTRWYSVADLEARTLWTRLDAEIAGHGGCAGLGF